MQERASGYPPIKDYAIIGDGRSAALVSRQGSIDWLCWPRFDSPSLFGAVLDVRRGGRFSIRPAGPFTARRRYVEETNVLETTFVTETGTLRLMDLMTIAPDDVDLHSERPGYELLRLVACETGTVEFEVRYEPRSDYGRVVPVFESSGPTSFGCNVGRHRLLLKSDFPLSEDPEQAAIAGRCRLQAGDERALSLLLHPGSDLPEPGKTAREKCERTIAFWRGWSGRCRYDGPYREAVLRSALVLKLLIYAPTGAVVAAPTTSLPETIGGVRNWDYRYCWLRDASMTLRALFSLGYYEEGEAFFCWLLRAAEHTEPELRPLYDVEGTPVFEEQVLDHLDGYRGSRPVRTGNAAGHQLQLDCFGDIADTAYEYVRWEHARLTPEQQDVLRTTGETVCERWREPDEGIWEIRANPAHHTYSKVMCWVTLDRLVRLHENGVLEVPVERFRETRDEIRTAIERHGFNTEIDSYTDVFGGDQVDASLLHLSTYGYTEATAPRMLATFACIEQRLSDGVLLYRYQHDRNDGLPPGEGAFGLCSFWEDEYLVRIGRLTEARMRFEGMLSYANDVGLFAEEVDADTGEALGNFPQGFTHIGLINTAVLLGEAAGRRE